MSNHILGKIAEQVKERLDARKRLVPFAQLKLEAEKSRNPHPILSAFESDRTRIIAEIKFNSPAVGALQNSNLDRALGIAQQYQAQDAAMISVLTERDHFAGDPDYLRHIRQACPSSRLLMKDFVIDEYQIWEARVWGADAVLLIVALIGEARTREYLKLTRELGLSALVEVHDEEELVIAHAADARLIGINNRNLKSLEVSLRTSHELSNKMQAGRIYISESGISSASEIRELKKIGYRGFLIGSAFMRASDPGQALQQLIEDSSK